MNEAIFTILSVIYLSSLAIVDGLFNRLIFREKRKLPYSSLAKKIIYKRWEWKAIGVIFLIILPIIFPSILSYLIGGISLLTLYWIILLLVPWDLIFGALVFDNLFGDTPSIAVPFYGWISLPLKLTLLIRLTLAVILIIYKITYEF